MFKIIESYNIQMKAKTKRNLAIGGGLLFLAGVATGSILILRRFLRTIPKGVDAVTPFEMRKFLGKWYVIGCTDNRFDRKLKNITMEFSVNEDGSISVIRRGHEPGSNKMRERKGTAVFADRPNVGKLKVSFSGPLYTGCNILETDPEYKTALLGGEDLNQIWLLSRKPDMLDEIAERYLVIADAYRYDISGFTWVEQDDY